MESTLIYFCQKIGAFRVEWQIQKSQKIKDDDSEMINIKR